MANIEDLRIDQAVPKPRRRRPSPWPWIIAGLVLLGWLFMRGGVKLPAASSMRSMVAGTTEVEVFTVPSQTSGPPGSISAGGYLEVIPPGPSVVSALVPGKVSDMLVVPGQEVSAGMILAKVDSSLLQQEARLAQSDVDLAQSRLARAKAGFRSEEIAQAEAALRSSEARRDKSRADLARMEELYSKGVISMSELETFRSDSTQAEQDVASRQSALNLLRSGTRPEEIQIAQAEVDSARARLEEINWRIGQCSLKAPRDGVVYEQLAQEGDWLSPLDGMPDGAAVCSLIDPKQIQAYVDINQRDSESIKLGQSVSITTDSQPGREIKGSVSRIMPRANLQKNTVQVKISIVEPPVDLRPELSVKVTFLPPDTPDDSAPANPGVLVPTTALTEKDGQQGAFVISGEQASWRQIESGGTEGSDTRVLSGIGPGDQVILSPQGLSDGQKVKIKAAEQQQ